EQRKAFGQVLNDFKQFAETKFEELKANLNGHNGQQIESAAKPDLSLPGEPISIGSRHPINLVRQRVITIFQRLGFAVADGPQIEDDWQHFTALHIDEDHPARDMQDTFYISKSPDWLLRTHTSNTQVREM